MNSQIGASREVFVGWILLNYEYSSGCGVRFGFETSPDHKGNVLSIDNSLTNNNMFVIGSIDFNVRFCLHLQRKV